MGFFHTKPKQEHTDYSSLAQSIVETCGGKTNIVSADACITRLRLTLHDPSKVDYSNLSRLGIKDYALAENQQLQLIYGTKAYQVLQSIHALL